MWILNCLLFPSWFTNGSISTKKPLQASQKYPDSFYFIRYEDLVTEPAMHLQKLCEFLDISYVPGVFDFYKMKDKAREKYPVRYSSESS